MNCRLVIVLILLVWGLDGRTEEPITPWQAGKAVENGVGWLLRHQHEAGYFDKDPGAPPPKGAGSDYTPSFSGAYAGLVVMALHDAGHRASDATPEGLAMLRAVKFVSREPPSKIAKEAGYLGQNDRSRMYGHGIMTWMLASVARELPDRKLQQEVLERVGQAVALIVSSQNVVRKLETSLGGWRYEPQSMDSDLSVTVWQMMALRAAMRAGIEVPPSTFKAAGEFVKRCRSKGAPAAQPADETAFTYEALSGKWTFSTTAAGTVAMQCSGLLNAEATKGGLAFISRHDFKWSDRWFYYGLCHGSHAMQEAGANASDAFPTKVRKTLVRMQAADGSWPPSSANEKTAGPLYHTAMAVMALAPWSEKTRKH